MFFAGVWGDARQQHQQKTAIVKPVEAVVAPMVKTRDTQNDKKVGRNTASSRPLLPPSSPSHDSPPITTRRPASERHESYQRQVRGDSSPSGSSSSVAAVEEVAPSPLHKDTLDPQPGSGRQLSHGPGSYMSSNPPSPQEASSTTSQKRQPTNLASDLLPPIDLPVMPTLSSSDSIPNVDQSESLTASIPQGNSMEALRERAQMALRAAAAASDASQRAAASSAAASAAASR